ncbi:Rho termination factor N-terminal domain-containing protein, partial [Mycobacterium simiae]
MTDTDLFTADESTDGNQLSDAVTTTTPDVKSKVSTGSLSTLVLPELRALASQAGVKGTSGMRKNELIAAIKEIRGQANGAGAEAAPTTDTGSGNGDGDKTKNQEKNRDNAKAEAPAAQGEQQDSAPEAAPRRERRTATREAGSSGRGD